MNVAISRFNFSTVLLICFLFVLVCSASQVNGACNDPIYVDSSASGTGSGTSWTNAMNSLQDGLAEAVTCGSSAVWVAAGAYKPDQGMAQTPGDRLATFQLVNGIAIYGGFPTGGGDGTFGARDIATNVTTLSGDLAGDDTPLACVNDSPDCDANGGLCSASLCIIAQNNAENSIHIVTGNLTVATAQLDGCTIAAGNADNPGTGGGLLNVGGSPTVSNCIFKGNMAVIQGGGMFNSESSTTVTNCSFIGNAAGSVSGSGGGMFNFSIGTVANCIFTGNLARDGGGMMNVTLGASPTITNCSFDGNRATFEGGGMNNNSGANPTVTDCTFNGNSADFGGGAMAAFVNSHPILTDCVFSGNSAGSRGGGAILTGSNDSSLNITNCTFSGNSGDTGGAIQFVSIDGTSTVTNCTFTGNSAAGDGAGIYNWWENITVTNCVLWNNNDSGGTDESAQVFHGFMGTEVVNYSIVQGGWTGAGGVGNGSSDPAFIDADGADNIVGTVDDNLRLISGSSAIDAGDNSAVPVGVIADLDGNPRFVNDPATVDTGVGTPPIVDMGAYEFQIVVCGDGIVDSGEACDDGNIAGGDGCSSTCTVESGYTCDASAPSICTDIDECALATDNCDVNATCTNTPGSFTCTCNTGYSGSGVTCTDDDECTLGTDNCDVNATCTNTPGSFTCACNPGYSGDGVTCMDDDECLLGTDNCDINSTCSNTPGSFNCICNAGYSCGTSWVTVGNPGNSGIGSVSFEYQMAKYEVTNDQYAVFVNAVATTDANGLYSVFMGSNLHGGITRSGSSGSFLYSIKANMGNKPVNFVSFFDAMRYVNWLHNGQPTGVQDASTTEDGVYAISDGVSETRTPDAQFFIPTEKEWVKAAYHQPSSQGGAANDYWLFPTASNSVPTIATATATGDISNPGANVANFSLGAVWNGVINVTTVGSAGPLSASFYGTFDQGGNVYEWTQTVVTISTRRIRGGAFDKNSAEMEASFSFVHLVPTWEGDNFGFRVARLVSTNCVVGETCTDDDECALATDNCDVNATCTNTPGSFTCTCNPGYLGDGITCLPPAPPLLAATPNDLPKQKYISIDATSNGTRPLAIRVEETTTGNVMWADVPFNGPDINSISPLSPSPVVMDWSAFSVLHLTGCIIQPFGVYEITFVDDPLGAAVASAARPVSTACAWGDIQVLTVPPACDAGIGDIIESININTFSSTAAFSSPHGDVQGDVMDGALGIGDIIAAINSVTVAAGTPLGYTPLIDCP